LKPTYRIGNGLAGQRGAEAIAHVITNQALVSLEVRNPLPAQRGTDPESIELVRHTRPKPFGDKSERSPKRIMPLPRNATPKCKSAATRRWTGSWYTMFVTVDRKLGQPVNAEF